MTQLGLCFLAGIVSFLSPCVLPLIPVYLTYLTGSTLEELKSTTPKRLVLAHAGFFVLGFSLVFVVMGASASAVGSLLLARARWVEIIGGVVLVVLGLWMSGALKIAFLHREARFHFHDKPAGYFGSVMVGGAFAAGWTPCVGPPLALALGFASVSGSIGKGVLFLTAYSLGFAIPLLLCALAVERFGRLLKRVGPWLPAIERATGVVLAVLGILLLTGQFSRQSTKLLSMFPGWTKFVGSLGL